MTYPAAPPVEPRVVAAAGAAIVAGLLFLLYLNRRRAYVLFWVAGWVLIAAGMVVLGDDDRFGGDLPRFASAYQALNIASALAFALSAPAVTGAGRWTKRDMLAALAATLVLAGWIAFGAPRFSLAGALAPGYLMTATALAVAAGRYARIARREQFTGAGLLATGLAIVAVSNVWMVRAVALASPEIVLRLMGLNFVAYAIATLGMHLLIFEDTTKELRLSNKRLEAAREELRGLALTDPLTGAYNRRFFDEIITRELERHRRAGQPLSVVFLDVDRFKIVNDVHGHAIGDMLLRDVSEYLRRKLRETDYVFRWGGDEFLVLMSCPAADAMKRMAALEAEYESAPLVSSLGNGVGISVGCAEAPPGTKDVEAVIAAADEDMYLKKRAAV